MVRRLAFVLEVDPSRFAQFAGAYGWRKAETQLGSDGDVDSDRPEQGWRTPDGGEVRYVNDTVLPGQYVDIAADHAEDVIREEFTAYDQSEAVEVLDLEQSEVTVCHALRLVACTAPGPFARQVFDVVIEAMHDERTEVQITALKTPRYTKWTEFLPEVTRLAAETQDDDVAGAAGTVQMLLEVTKQAEGTR